jgi:peptidoglycan/xylan/chitin deacetylase (PgdA/CDA1 family)
VIDVLVLSYHAVSRNWPAALSVLPDRFEAQMRLLAARGYRGATLHDAVHDPPSPLTVAVTFDDAYRSVFDEALPILNRVGFPATVFVPTDFPDSQSVMSWPGIDRWLGGPHADELRCLSWDQLQALADVGWEIGSHTCSHPHLTELGDEDLARELSGSRERCEENLHLPCRSLAYPYGDFDGRVVSAARDAGFTAACIVTDGLAPAGPLVWPRVGIYHDDGAASYRVKVSRAVRHLRMTRIGESVVPLLRSARAARRSVSEHMRRR